MKVGDMVKYDDRCGNVYRGVIIEVTTGTLAFGWDIKVYVDGAAMWLEAIWCEVVSEGR